MPLPRRCRRVTYYDIRYYRFIILSLACRALRRCCLRTPILPHPCYAVASELRVRVDAPAMI